MCVWSSGMELGLDAVILPSQDLHHDAELSGASASSGRERNPSTVAGGWVGVLSPLVCSSRSGRAGGPCALHDRDHLHACAGTDYANDGTVTLLPASEANDMGGAAEGLASGRRVVSVTALASVGLGASGTGAPSQVGSRRLSPFHPVCIRMTGRGAWWWCGAGHWVACW